MSSPVAGWKRKRISELAENVFAGATPNTKISSFWENGNIPWMSSGEINNETIEGTASFITEDGFNNSSTKMVPIHSVLVALAGQGKTRGKVATNKIELCTNQSLAAIVPNQQIFYKYLYYNLQRRYVELRELSSGDGGRGGLNLKLINGISVDFPPLPEQKKIAEILSTWDEAIELENQKIVFKKQYRDSFVKMMILRLEKKHKLTTTAQRIKSFLIESRDRVGNNDITPVAVGVNGIRLRTEIYSKELSSDYSNNKILRANDICFGIGTDQIVYGVLLSKNIYSVSPAYRVFNIVGIDPFYLKCYLDTKNTVYSKKYMIISARQGKSVNIKGLLNEMIIVPPLAVQQQFSKVVTEMDNEIQLLEKERDLLNTQKQGLMQRLLTGKVRVKLD